MQLRTGGDVIRGCYRVRSPEVLPEVLTVFAVLIHKSGVPILPPGGPPLSIREFERPNALDQAIRAALLFHDTRIPCVKAGDRRIHALRIIMVQISSAETCMSCHPPALRVSRAAATTSVKVRPPYTSPMTDAGGSALACFTVETFVIIDSVDRAPENAGRMRILSPASERTREPINC